MSAIGITKSVYKIKIKTNVPAIEVAVDSLVEEAAIALKQIFIASVTVKANKRNVLLGRWVRITV